MPKLTIAKSQKNLNEFVRNDLSCVEQLRMDRHTFFKLCEMLRTIGGLKDTKNMLVEKTVAIFLNILAHDVKNRMIKNRFKRSQEIIIRHFRMAL